MNYLFFLVIFLIPVGIASAETGKDFDTEELGNGLIQWTSHYDRLYDGNSWENYILTNDATQIRFQSSGIDFVFDKTNCVFKLYDPLDQALEINSYKFDLSIDAILQPSPTCDVINFLQTEDTINFYIDQGLFKTKFDLEPSMGMEWTHEIDNNEGKTSTFTITETCQDCIVESIDETRINFGAYTLDTKNEIHDTVKDTRADKGDYIIEYEKTISDKEKLIIDPTFTQTGPSSWYALTDVNNGVDDFCDVGSTKTSRAGTIATATQVYIAGGAGDCQRSVIQFNTASIPDHAQISSVTLNFDVSTVTNGRNCDVWQISNEPVAASAATLFTDARNGNQYARDNTSCASAGNNKSIILSNGSASNLGALLPSNWFAVGLATHDETFGGGVEHITNVDDSGTGTPRPQLIVYYTGGPINAVKSLIAIDVRPNSVDLDWITPPPSNGTIIGYEINRTTPWNSNVATIHLNDTGNVQTSYTVSGLTGSTQYSFRVGSRAANNFVNATGNVLNVTTDFDPTASFSTGTFSTLFNGTDIREIFYSRTDINSTSLWLNVTATNTIQLNCNFYYKYSMVNRTFTNIANTSISATRDMATFRFLNVDNEVVDVLCWNQYDNTTNARYLITQTNFPFLEQIANFRNGTYGTMGMFGALDFISMIAVIASMIGFNRVNESVGIIFGLFMIGGLAVLSNGEIISWASTFTVGFAVLIMWAITQTRKD